MLKIERRSEIKDLRTSMRIVRGQIDVQRGKMRDRILKNWIKIRIYSSRNLIDTHFRILDKHFLSRKSNAAFPTFRNFAELSWGIRKRSN